MPSPTGWQILPHKLKPTCHCEEGLPDVAIRIFCVLGNKKQGTDGAL